MQKHRLPDPASTRAEPCLIKSEVPEAGTTVRSSTASRSIKLAVELGPLLVFFIGNSRYGIFAGTGAFMVATFVVAHRLSRRLGRIATMPLVSGVFVLVFGGLTLWLQDDHFIKIKPTIVNGLFAAICLADCLAAGCF